MIGMWPCHAGNQPIWNINPENALTTERYLNRRLTPSRGGRFDKPYQSRGYVTRYDQVIVGRIGLRSVSTSVTGLFRVLPSRTQAECLPRSEFDPASYVLDGRNVTGSGVPVSKNVSNTRLDTCVHEAGVSIDPSSICRCLVCARRQSQFLFRCS